MNTKHKSDAMSFRLTNVAIVHSLAFPDLRPLIIETDYPFVSKRAKNIPLASDYFHPMAAKYQAAAYKVADALAEMTTAMEQMGAQHVGFHANFNEAQKDIQNLKKAHAPKELDAEVIRSIALECYVSETNNISVAALGHYEVEKALSSFHQQMKNLEEIRKKTAELVDSLSEDRNSKSGDGHGAKAESADEVDPDWN